MRLSFETPTKIELIDWKSSYQAGSLTIMIIPLGAKTATIVGVLKCKFRKVSTPLCRTGWLGESSQHFDSYLYWTNRKNGILIRYRMLGIR